MLASVRSAVWEHLQVSLGVRDLADGRIYRTPARRLRRGGLTVSRQHHRGEHGRVPGPEVLGTELLVHTAL